MSANKDASSGDGENHMCDESSWKGERDIPLAGTRDMPSGGRDVPLNEALSAPFDNSTIILHLIAITSAVVIALTKYFINNFHSMGFQIQLHRSNVDVFEQERRRHYDLRDYIMSPKDSLVILVPPMVAALCCAKVGGYLGGMAGGGAVGYFVGAMIRREAAIVIGIVGIGIGLAAAAGYAHLERQDYERNDLLQNTEHDRLYGLRNTRVL